MHSWIFVKGLETMVDNRSAGFFGIGGAFNFKSGDISGTAAKLSDDKMGQGGEYFSQRGGEEEGDHPRRAARHRTLQQSQVHQRRGAGAAPHLHALGKRRLSLCLL